MHGQAPTTFVAFLEVQPRTAGLRAALHSVAPTCPLLAVHPGTPRPVTGGNNRIDGVQPGSTSCGLTLRQKGSIMSYARIAVIHFQPGTDADAIIASVKPGCWKLRK